MFAFFLVDCILLLPVRKSFPTFPVLTDYQRPVQWEDKSVPVLCEQDIKGTKHPFVSCMNRKPIWHVHYEKYIFSKSLGLMSYFFLYFPSKPQGTHSACDQLWLGFPRLSFTTSQTAVSKTKTDLIPPCPNSLTCTVHRSQPPTFFTLQ